MRVHRNITPGKESTTYSGQLTRHKFFEFGWQRALGEAFHITFNLSFTGRDHAGLRFTVTIFERFFELSLYDHRHWDDDKNDWTSHG